VNYESVSDLTCWLCDMHQQDHSRVAQRYLHLIAEIAIVPGGKSAYNDFKET
jgi:hypothetical protein